MGRKNNTNIFVQKARNVHGRTYEYSKVKYERAHKHVIITCRKHGDFWQAPTNHLMGRGCPQCKGEKISKKQTKTTEQIIKEFKSIHKNKYDYAQVQYISGTTPVIIKCRKHGVFKQQPCVHLRGNGCPRCSYEKRGRESTKTTKQFVEEANEVHKYKYIYTKTKYKRGKDKVVITCQHHGDFKQSPSAHLHGSGCPKCSRPKPRSQKWFMQQARKIHGTRYKYNKTKYVGSKNKIVVTCKKHGDFVQTAGVHLRGAGCAKCNRKGNVITQAEFIVKATQIHGHTYEYTKTKYRGGRNNIIVMCPKHGQFSVNAGMHIGKHKQECPQCRKEHAICKVCGKKTKGRRHTLHTKDFIQQAIKVHKDKYKYQRSKCIRRSSSVTITCDRHGDFRQHVWRHLRGQGCVKCAQEATGKKLRSSQQKFIVKAEAIFGDTYLYDNCGYKGLRRNITVTCRIHGDFKVKAGMHLKKSGCPLCSGSSGEKRIAQWLRNHGVDFKKEWTKHTCIANKKHAKFDFYLPKYKTIVEYDGEQHFHPVKHWTGRFGSPQNALTNTQKLDRRKNRWAIQNGYTLVRIPYFADMKKELHKLKHQLGL